MSDQKKDMTGLMDYAKEMQDSGHAPAAPVGSVMEEQKIEKFDDFESLDEYGKNNPTPEPMPAQPAETQPENPFAVSAPSETPAAGDSFQNDFSTSADSDPFATPPAEQPLAPPLDLSEVDSSPAPDLQSPAASAASPADEFALPEEDASSPPLIAEPMRPAPRLSQPATTPTPAGMGKVKEYSEALSTSKSAVPASFPFSLLITGKLAPDEQARLLDILSRENMGIREIDMEPQLESGKILIPRISEYAGILIIGALRSSRTRMRFGPSDTIFATAETQDSGDATLDTGERRSEAHVIDASHAAEKIPITQASSIPGLERFTVIDVVLVTAAIRTMAVEAETSPEFGDLLEALKRELKFKAQRKGAIALLNFSVQLTPLDLPSQYRVVVSGTAVKADLASKHALTHPDD